MFASQPLGGIAQALGARIPQQNKTHGQFILRSVCVLLIDNIDIIDIDNIDIDNINENPKNKNNMLYICLICFHCFYDVPHSPPHSLYSFVMDFKYVFNVF